MVGDTSPEERARIVGLCVRLTGNADVAEDLAQETLFEAWRNEHKLREPDKRREWLSGIARNVCRRWIYSQGREIETITTETHEWEEDLPDERFDVTEELEYTELHGLLDRALDQLPGQTRDVLISRIADGMPQWEVAERLGVSEAAVAMRLRRGKQSLRRVLLTRMPAEAAEYGLLPPRGEWEETSIWCPTCGQSRLQGRFSPDRHGFWLRCPGCECTHVAFTEHGNFSAESPGFFEGVRGYRAALSRVRKHTHQLHMEVVAGPVVPCASCRQLIRARFDTDGLSVTTSCPFCGSSSYNGAIHLVHSLPEVRCFQSDNPRTRTLPPVSLESSGRDTVVIALESLRNASRLDVVLARDNLAVLGIHGDLRIGE